MSRPAAKGAFGRFVSGRSASAAYAQSLVTRVALIGANLLCGVIAARSLAPHGRGEQAAMLMWAQLFGYCATFGIPGALQYLLRSTHHPERLFGAALVLGTIQGVGAGVIGYFVVPHLISGNFSPVIVHRAQALVLLAPFTLLYIILYEASVACGELAVANRARISPPVITLVLLGLLAASGRLTPFSATIAYMLPLFPNTYVLGRHLWRHIGFSCVEFAATARRLLSFGGRIWASDIVGTLGSCAGSLYGAILLRPEELGLFIVALSIARTTDIVFGSLVTVLIPRINRASPAAICDMVGFSFRIVSVGAAVAFPIVILVLPRLVKLVYGHAFAEPESVLALLMADAIECGLGWLLAQSLLAMRRPALISFVQVLTLVLTFGGAAIAAPRWGIVGVSAAMMVADGVRLALFYAFYAKLFGPAHRALPTKGDFVRLRSLAAGVIFSVPRERTT